MAFDPRLGGTAASGSHGAVTSEKVELFLSCSDLIKMDLRSRSDPFIVVYLKDRRTGDEFKEIGRTRVIYDNHYPKFPEQFLLEYYFEEEQTLRFDVFDEDKKGSKRLSDHDVMGSCSMTLGEVVHSAGTTMAKKLMKKGKALKNKKSKRFSRLTATGNTVVGGSDKKLTMKLSASKLPKMDFFGSADPYVEIWRVKEGTLNEKETLVYTSEVIKKTKEPKWKMFESSLQLLCNGDKTRKVLFQVFDWDKGGSADFIGQCFATIDEVMRGFAIRKLIDHTKKKKKNRGHLSLSTTVHFQFLDYMSAGLDMGLVLAVDFTGSNMHPSHPRSLHFMSPSKPSPYQVAIRTIGNIVSVYDSDQMYPVYGFGAKVGGRVSHCFPLNFSDSEPEVKGISGVEAVYIECLPKVQLYGPTWAHPVLDKAIEKARFEHTQFRKGVVPHLQYTILMIMTDGAIMDMAQTIDRIVTIANDFLPISIIIIGIAHPPTSEAEAKQQEKEWENMRILDADDVPLANSRGMRARRDVVQFVKLTDYIRDGNINYNDLSKETLVEIPQQFLSYVEFHKFSPPSRVVPKMSEDQFVIPDAALRREDTLMALGACPTDVGLGTGPEPPLPDGWEKSYDEDGKAFYIDTTTMATSWVHPALADATTATTTTTAATTTAAFGSMTVSTSMPATTSTTATTGSYATGMPMTGAPPVAASAFQMGGATAARSAPTFASYGAAAPVHASPTYGSTATAPTTSPMYGSTAATGSMYGAAPITATVTTYGSPPTTGTMYGGSSAPMYGAPVAATGTMYGAPVAATSTMYGAPAAASMYGGGSPQYGSTVPATAAATMYGAPAAAPRYGAPAASGYGGYAPAGAGMRPAAAPPMGAYAPAGGYRPAATGGYPPAAASGYRPPATGYRPPATGGYPPATGGYPPASGGTGGYHHYGV